MDSTVQYFPKPICGLTSELKIHKVRVQATSESVPNGSYGPIGILFEEFAVKLKYEYRHYKDIRVPINHSPQNTSDRDIIGENVNNIVKRLCTEQRQITEWVFWYT